MPPIKHSNAAPHRRANARGAVCSGRAPRVPSSIRSTSSAIVTPLSGANAPARTTRNASSHHEFPGFLTWITCFCMPRTNGSYLPAFDARSLVVRAPVYARARKNDGKDTPQSTGMSGSRFPCRRSPPPVRVPPGAEYPAVVIRQLPHSRALPGYPRRKAGTARLPQCDRSFCGHAAARPLLFFFLFLEPRFS